jgi:shikimate 5-dehydrogenase
MECRDLALRSPRSAYREIEAALRNGFPTLIGALITSHKAGLFDAAADLFDEITPTARQLGEIGMVYWRSGALVGDANDALSTRRVLLRLCGQSPAWKGGGHEAVILGAGGAGVALAHALAEGGADCRHVTIVERDPARVELVSSLVRGWNTAAPIRVLLAGGTSDDIVMASKEGSLIANATGLGKDQPGSPVSSSVVFPRRAIVWDFNYRFVPQEVPTFLETAERQRRQQALVIEDGWDYFVWGWLGVMANACGLEPALYHECFAQAARRVKEG